MKTYRLLFALFVLMFVAGCSFPTGGASPTSSPFVFVTVTPNTAPGATQTPSTSPNVATATSPLITAASPTPQAAATALPAATDTAVQPTSVPPTATSAPAQSASPTAASGNPDAFPYLDDRSTATGVINSLYNAINRKEYVRAYSYWDPSGAATFAQYQQGYATTQSVQVTIGPVFHDEGAGQTYFSIGVLLKSTLTNNTVQTYTACYNLHLGSPSAQGVPPFVPLRIEDGKAAVVAAGADTTNALAHSCDGIAKAAQPASPAPVTNTQDITAANYLDDRTGPVEVLSSLFNAVNRHEYLRAYSYWETNSAVGPYAQFQQGYADTASVAINTGAPVNSNGAGQIYYSLPVVLVAKTTSNTTQTFAGCYKFHLSRPEIQGVPPFMPLAIMSATVNTVANNADQAALLKTACAGQ